MPEEEVKNPGTFNQRRYAQGFRHAVEDVEDESIEYAESHARSMSGRTWYSIGYNTGIAGIKEGQAL